jgi:hypothetical protein
MTDPTFFEQRAIAFAKEMREAYPRLPITIVLRNGDSAVIVSTDDARLAAAALIGEAKIIVSAEGPLERDTIEAARRAFLQEKPH